MTNIKKTLENLWLNDKEIKIYLTSLWVWQTSASILWQKNKIARTTAIYTCQSLVEKWLMNAVQKWNSFLYSPEPPEKLLSMVNKEYSVVEKKMSDTQRIMWELNNLMNPNAKLPKVKYFSGSEGMIDLIDDIFTTKFTHLYWVMEYIDDMPKEVMEYIKKEYIPKRKKMKIVSRFIMNNNKKSIDYAGEMKWLDRIILFADKKEFPFSWYMQIYWNKVALFSYKKWDMSWILIENEYIKNMLFSIFKISWDACRHLEINKQNKDITL